MNHYTCPMDPDIIKNAPGKCPKCGMDLVPVKKEESEHENHPSHGGMEQEFKRRFFIALPLTLAILILSPKIQQWLGFSIQFPNINLVLFALASFVVFYTGLPFYKMAEAELKNKTPAMMSLVSLAVLSGYFFSVAATFLFEGQSLYWEVSTLVLAFLFGHWIEMRAVRGATGALQELAKLTPQMAHLLKGKEVEEVKTQNLKKGDVILIKPGEKIPIDGIVIEGESSTNESMVSGESRPQMKKTGDEVIGGTVNNDGSLKVKVNRTGEETAISQMMKLITEAQQSKPPVQKLADKAAGYLTYIALIVGVSTFIFWFFIFPQGAVFAATLSIAVIVIACPHALGLAIPTVTTIATSLAAKNGILIKDMKAAEISRKLTYVVFDKTGTLTEGKFGVSQVASIDKKIPGDQILSDAASVEYYSEHSIATGILEGAKLKGIKVKKATNFKSFPGKGAQAKVGGSDITVGTADLMTQIGITKSEISKIKLKTTGTLIYVAQNKKLKGAIILTDTIREESKEAINMLKKLGIKTAMLTGDGKDVADSVAKQLNIDTVFSQVLPKDKVNKVKELQQKGEIVAMVGDGVNDAPSLTQSHVGIAIGAGTGVAVESAQIVLIKNNPKDVVKAISLSRKINTKMKQNLAWATGYNLIAIPAAAGVFSSFDILLRPEWSALIMSASSVIVVFNALLLKREVL